MTVTLTVAALVVVLLCSHAAARNPTYIERRTIYGRLAHGEARQFPFKVSTHASVVVGVVAITSRNDTRCRGPGPVRPFRYLADILQLKSGFGPQVRLAKWTGKVDWNQTMPSQGGPGNGHVQLAKHVRYDIFLQNTGTCDAEMVQLVIWRKATPRFELEHGTPPATTVGMVVLGVVVVAAVVGAACLAYRCCCHKPRNTEGATWRQLADGDARAAADVELGAAGPVGGSNRQDFADVVAVTAPTVSPDMVVLDTVREDDGAGGLALHNETETGNSKQAA
jgi:hypothetical protein